MGQKAYMALTSLPWHGGKALGFTWHQQTRGELGSLATYIITLLSKACSIYCVDLAYLSNVLVHILTQENSLRYKDDDGPWLPVPSIWWKLRSDGFKGPVWHFSCEWAPPWGTTTKNQQLVWQLCLYSESYRYQL